MDSISFPNTSLLESLGEASRFQTPDEHLVRRLDRRHTEDSAPQMALTALVEHRVKRHCFRDSLLHHPSHDLASQQDRLRRRLHDAVVIPEGRETPAAPRMVSTRSYDDHIVEEIEIEVTPPLFAPATVVVPRNGKKRHPAVVVLHSMGNNRVYGREKLLAFDGEPAWLTEYRQTFYDGKSIQRELARAGYLSIAIDAQNFGSRTQAATENRAEFLRWRAKATAAQARDFTRQVMLHDEAVTCRQLLSVGLSTPALTVTDDLRTVDYLVGRADVDHSRIACMGLSFGSFRANYLAALDRRVRAAISACWLSTHRGVIHHNLLGALGFFCMPPGLFQHMDLADIVALAAPKPFLALSGWEDMMIEPFGMAEAHLFFRRVWRELNAADNLGSLIYQAPHTFNREMQRTALNFLNQHLGDVS